MSKISDLTDKELAKIISQSNSLSDALINIGYRTGKGGTPKTELKNRIIKLNLPTDHFYENTRQSKSKIKSINKTRLQQIINESQTWSEVLYKLGYNAISGDLVKNLKEYTKQNNINTKALSNPYHKNKLNKKLSHEEVFTQNAKCDRTVLKKHLIQIGRTPNKCEICGMKPIWNGKPLTLTLDHINGINNDNRLNNLRWICPNCDSQTPTYKGRNVKHEKLPKYKCKHCGRPITSQATLCPKCNAASQRKVEWPSKNQLIEDIKSMPMTKVGKKYGVSDNAIRKWCKTYGINYKAIKNNL